MEEAGSSNLPKPIPYLKKAVFSVFNIYWSKPTIYISVDRVLSLSYSKNISQ